MAFDQATADQLTQELLQDPAYMELVQAANRRFPGDSAGMLKARNDLAQYLQAKGITDTSYSIEPGTGRVIKNESLWEQTPGWAKAVGIGTLGLAAAPFALNALGVGGAAGGAAGAGSTGGATAGAGLGSKVLSGLGGWGGLIEGGLRAAGGIAQGRAQERLAEAELASRADATRLGAAGFNRQTPGVRATDAVRGDVLAGVQPYQLSGEGRNIAGSGGLSPALLSQNTRDLGRQMNRQAFLSQMGQGGPTDPYANFVPTNSSKAGKLDTALGIAGVAGSVIPLLGGLPFGPKTPIPQPDDINDIYGRYSR